MNIYLIGFRGTGKTTVGRLLAKYLEREFIDADDYLEKKIGKTIKQIFQEGGEGLFRDMEGEVIRELSGIEDKIVAAGGGAVLREKNVRNMKRNGLVILLEADAHTIHDRLQRDPRSHTQRPNLTNLDSLNEIIHLLEYRRPYYEKAADHRIDTTTISPAEAVKAILSIYKSRSKNRPG
ncbi:MAG TPA: shikimate kinase [Candidatus Tripitaka californicus]|uniref:shikimate kinase n=1 Tax=Candidatus Tripitaka californicus TaxID=3367616 RepID=UPI00402587AA